MAAPRDLPPIRPAINVVMPIPGEKPATTPNRAADGPSCFEELADRPITLSAPQGKTVAQIDAELNPNRFNLKPEDLPQEKPPEGQFNLRELLIITTCAAFAMAGVRWFPNGTFLFAVQMVMIVVLVGFAIAGATGRQVSLVCWCFVVMYITGLVANVFLIPY